VFDGDPTEGERVVIDSDDQEMLVDGSLTFNSDAFSQRIGLDTFEFEVGVSAKQKTRDFGQRTFEDDNDLDFADPGEEETDLGASGNFEFEENRLDYFAQVELGLSPSFTVQTGARVEHTETDANLIGGAGGSSESTEFYPSVHVQWDVWEDGQIRVSGARTARRPLLDQLVPFEDEEAPGDDDVTVGNPNLSIETAWGYDIGYEHRIGERGIIGVNFFHRNVSDLISLVAVPGGDCGGCAGSLYTYQNIGDGEVWGWEVDISTPLGFIGLPETGFFANYTDLNSERIDPFTGIETTFNAQPEYVYNWGLSHNIPTWNTSFGFSYRKQGKSRSLFLGEIEDQWYDANLEVFLEHRISENVVMRIVGNNLLDADSIQSERNYDGDSAEEIRDEMLINNVDEFEIERENSSPTVMVTLRAVF
jgi:outer membrane receptor protein involved in Fe transport